MEVGFAGTPQACSAMVIKGTTEDTLHVYVTERRVMPNGNPFMCLGDAPKKKRKKDWAIGKVEHDIPVNGSLIEMTFFPSREFDTITWDVTWERVS